MQQPFTILALGEILWDVFPDGPRFGGAPANFACMCQKQSSYGRHQGERVLRPVEVFMASAVGTDQLGAKALVRLESFGVNTSLVQRNDRPTGQVLVTIDTEGNATYRFVDDTAWDSICPTTQLAMVAAKADVICFGSLGQRSSMSRNTICSTLRTAAPNALKIFDINLRPPFDDPEIIRQSLLLANVLKLNDEELPVLAKMLCVSGTEVELMTELRDRYGVLWIALTRGAKGATLFRSSQERYDAPAKPVKVVNTVGAGDAFTAVLALGLLNQLPPDEVLGWAIEVAAAVCSGDQ